MTSGGKYTTICYRCKVYQSRPTSAKRKTKATLCAFCFKEMRKKTCAKYDAANQEKLKAKRKEWKIKNKEKIRQQNMEYSKKNRDILTERQRERRRSNGVKPQKYIILDEISKKERMKIYYQRSYSKPEYRRKAIERAKKRAILKKDEVTKYKIEWDKKRCEEDPLYKLKSRIRKRVSMAFSAAVLKKRKSTQILLGAPWQIVFFHIERQFKPKMSWDNYGEWHIDHIIPLCTAKSEAELMVLCNYMNLQPLWKKENLSKGGKRTCLL